MNKLFPIVLVLSSCLFSQLNLSPYQGQSNLPISEHILDSIAKPNSPDYERTISRSYGSTRVTEQMRKNAEKSRKESFYKAVWVSISWCVALFILIKVVIYFKRKRDKKIEQEIKKNEDFRRLKKRVNKLENYR